MSLLTKPSDTAQHFTLKGLIYGQPGVCKSTLSLSGPNPVMIDADKGMYRVEKRFQTASLPLNEYEKVLELFQGPELNQFESVSIDTLGKFIDRMADYLMRQNPKLRQADGSLTLKGYGGLRMEFQKFLKLAETKNKHLIFVAHEREEKDGDVKVIRPDVSGSSGKDLIKDLDFVGYVEMRGGKRTISFTPSERFYAKNSLKLPQIMEIPHTDENPNDFIQRVIIARTLEKMTEESALGKQYEDIVQNHKARIAEIITPDEATNIAKEINSSTPLWDSARVAKKILAEKARELGFSYNKETFKFEVAEQGKKDEVSSNPIAA